MSLKDRSSSLNPGTVLSVFCLLLYSAGFIRIELKFNDHDQRLVAVEEVISKLKQGMADTLIKGAVFRHINSFLLIFWLDRVAFAQYPSYFNNYLINCIINFSVINRLNISDANPPRKELEHNISQFFATSLFLFHFRM